MKFITNHFLKMGVVLCCTVTTSAFASCDTASNSPRPEWLNRGYSLAGYYVSIGTAERSGNTPAQQREISENDAKKHLVEEIEVTIESKYENNTEVINNLVNQYASSKLTSKTELMLRDLKVKERWTDKESCTLHTLVIISNESAAHAKNVKLHTNRLESMKALLARGADKGMYKEAKARQQYLEDAQLIFNEIDFTVLNESYTKAVYMKKITDMLASVRNEISQSQGRIALFALNPDGKIPSEVVAKMLDQIRAGNTKADRLMVACSAASECLDKAKERGFEMLTWLKIDGRIEVSNMGALKGTVSVSKTLYDVKSRHVINKPVTASAQVIGWGNDEINWESAAEKAIQDLH